MIKPCETGREFVAFCDMSLAGGNWTIIQRRVNNKISFERDYKSYQNGFGDFTENFWLGLDKLHCLTSSQIHTELYIGLNTFYEVSRYAHYGTFSVGPESDGYRLRVTNYLGGPAGNSMRDHNNMKFSTHDRDQDNLDRFHCAQIAKGGWWYNNCFSSNLNGLYYPGGYLSSNAHNGMVWTSWLGFQYSFKTTIIAIRPHSD